MSIVAHLPRLDPTTGLRLGGADLIDSSQPPTGLLPDGGIPRLAPAPAPTRVLARDALRLIRMARATHPAPITWFGGDLSREIETIRRQLEPIRSRRALSASYRREAINLAGAPDANGWQAGVVRFAYTLRWLELGSDRP